MILSYVGLSKRDKQTTLKPSYMITPQLLIMMINDRQEDGSRTCICPKSFKVDNVPHDIDPVIREVLEDVNYNQVVEQSLSIKAKITRMTEGGGLGLGSEPHFVAPRVVIRPAGTVQTESGPYLQPLSLSFMFRLSSVAAVGGHFDFI